MFGCLLGAGSDQTWYDWLADIAWLCYWKAVKPGSRVGEESLSQAKTVATYNTVEKAWFLSLVSGVLKQ